MLVGATERAGGSEGPSGFVGSEGEEKEAKVVRFSETGTMGKRAVENTKRSRGMVVVGE